jgi:protein-L-isoaspartate(D-aspartate) O-methyltransferase
MPWARLTAAVPGVLGRPDRGPYDRILVSAGAATLPGELVGQLAPEGVMVIPVAGRMLRVENAEGGPAVEEHGWYRFVPLVADPPTGPVDRLGWPG